MSFFACTSDSRFNVFQGTVLFCTLYRKYLISGFFNNIKCKTKLFQNQYVISGENDIGGCAITRDGCTSVNAWLHTYIFSDTKFRFANKVKDWSVKEKNRTKSLDQSGKNGSKMEVIKRVEIPERSFKTEKSKRRKVTKWQRGILQKKLDWVGPVDNRPSAN